MSGGGVMIGRVSIFFGIIGFVMLVGGVNAATAINSCGVISSPGTYELQNNIINSSAIRCIEIKSSDVIFDGQGNTIDGTGGFNNGVTVYNSTSTLTNVTVRNLIVTDGYYGIHYQAVVGGKISGINASSNTYGIYFKDSNNGILTDNNANSNGYGISFVYSNNSIITNNNVDLNLNTGIILSSSNNNTITDNSANINNDTGISLADLSSKNTITGNIVNNTAHGIRLDYSDNNTLDGNIMTNNTGCGIHFISSISNNLTNNIVSQNIQYGVVIDDSYSTWIYHNNVSSNGDDGMTIMYSDDNIISGNTVSDNGYGGIYIYNSSNNIFTGNNFSGNSREGITVNLSSSGNIIKDNTVSGNNLWGIYLQSSSSNTIYNNYLGNDNNSYDDSTNDWNTTKMAGTNIVGGPYTGGNYYSDYSGNDTDGDGIGDVPYPISGGLDIDYLPLIDTTPPQSNQTTFNISLLAGWNLISLPLVPENTSIPAVLASIDGNYTVVYAWIDGAWKKSTASRNPLTDMTPEYGYWVDMTVPDTLELTGTLPASMTINVSTGWNLVGYPSVTTRNLTDVLSPINYSVVYAWIGGAWKKSTASRNPLTEMSPRYGYWIDANGAGSYEVKNINQTTTTTFNISLSPGWNLISLPLAPENTSIPAVLASIEGNYTVVYAWIDGAWKKSTASRNPLTDMTLEYGYWVDMTVPDTLELSGTLPASTTINVSTGWNLVGYPSITTRNLTDVLSPINYSVVYAWMDGAWKKSTASRNPLTEMGPGYGYWIDANGTGSYVVLN